MSRLKITLMIVNTMFVMCEAQCPANKIENPPETDRSYSSVRVGNNISMLDSSQTWCNGNSLVSSAWITIDLKVQRTVVGIAIQGKNDLNQFVTSVEIFSSTDGVTYATSYGRNMDINGLGTLDFIAQVFLLAKAKIRFLKIQALHASVWPCMRVGVILECVCGVGFTGPDGGPCTGCPANTYKSISDIVCQQCPYEKISLTNSTSLAACKFKPLFGVPVSCGNADASIMTSTLCADLAGQNSITVPTAAALGTTQLVRYTFANSWGCHLQANLTAPQRISGAAPNQVLECPTVPGAIYVKQDAPCQFACNENHTCTSDTCTRVCGNATAAACEPRHFASMVCNHAGYTLYQCKPCAYAEGQQAQPWSALTAAACPTAPCAAGTYGAGGVCLPCSMNNFSAAGSAACSPCARGTFALAGSGVCATCFQVPSQEACTAGAVATQSVAPSTPTSPAPRPRATTSHSTTSCSTSVTSVARACRASPASSSRPARACRATLRTTSPTFRCRAASSAPPGTTRRRAARGSRRTAAASRGLAFCCQARLPWLIRQRGLPLCRLAHHQQPLQPCLRQRQCMSRQSCLSSRQSLQATAAPRTLTRSSEWCTGSLGRPCPLLHNRTTLAPGVWCDTTHYSPLHGTLRMTIWQEMTTRLVAKRTTAQGIKRTHNGVCRSLSDAQRTRQILPTLCQTKCS